MLSDHERKTLREVERQFMLEDPGFAQSFDTDAQHLHRDSPGLPRWAYTILLVISSTLGLILLVAGSLSGALTFAVVTGLIWAAWRYLDGTSRRAT
ncbi:MAG: DUF3040 domain-containing protein [Pseudonocardiales bacterium]